MSIIKNFINKILTKFGYTLRKNNNFGTENTFNDNNKYIAEIKSYVDSRLDYHHKRSPTVIKNGDLIFTHLTGGQRILLDPCDLNMTLHVLESGNWEPYMVNFLRRQLNPDDVFVDVGSNIGLTSIYAKDFLYPTIGRPRKYKRIYCFEPIPETFEILKKNALANDFAYYSVLENMAVGNETKEIEFEHCIDYVAASAKKLSNTLKSDLMANYKTIKIKSTKLDDYFKKGTVINLIKIDVEGFESDVILGAKRVIQENRDIALVIEWTPSILDEQNLGSHVDEAVSFLESEKFRVFHIGSHIWVKDGVGGHAEELPVNAEVEITFERFKELKEEKFSGDLVFKR